MFYLRLYECLQLMMFGAVGLISHYPLSFLIRIETFLYFLVFFTHLLFIYSFNDLCDLDIDLLNPRKRQVAAKNPKILRILVWMFLIVSTTLSLYLSATLFLIFLVLNLIGVIYSKLNNRILAGIPFGQLFHFIPGFLYFYLGIIYYRGEIYPPELIAACSFGCVYAAGGLLNEVIDLEYDRDYGLKTTAIMLGAKPAYIIVVYMQALAILGLNLFLPNIFLLFVSAVGGLFHYRLIKDVKYSFDQQDAMIRFRRQSRIYFGVIILIIIAIKLISYA